MTKILFEAGETEMVSPAFRAPATIAGYNLTATTVEKDDNGMAIKTYCGDYVTFERLLTANDYDLDCKLNIESEGVIATAPLTDECGRLIKLTACRNVIQLPYHGNYRAIYHGDGRANATVTKD